MLRDNEMLECMKTCREIGALAQVSLIRRQFETLLLFIGMTNLNKIVKLSKSSDLQCFGHY